MNMGYSGALNALSMREAQVDCPICGGDEWHAPGAIGNLLGAVPLATPSGEAVRDLEGDRGAVLAYVLLCQTCGFVRMHATDVLEKP